MDGGSRRGERGTDRPEAYSLPGNWKGVLASFGQALSEEGSSGLASTYEMLMRGPIRFRAALRAIESVFPLKRVGSMGAEFDARIARDGLSEASRWLLTESGIPWKAEFPEIGRELLESGPLVIYGNHPSLATPFILAAVLEHPRLGYISSAYVSNLLPAMVPHLFAVELIRHQQVRNRPGSGVAHLVAHSLLADIYERPSREVARAANREVISNAAKHVTQGGALVIYPAGGGKDRLWYPIFSSRRSTRCILFRCASTTTPTPVCIAPCRTKAMHAGRPGVSTVGPSCCGLHGRFHLRVSSN